VSPRQCAADLLSMPSHYPAPGESLWLCPAKQRPLRVLAWTVCRDESMRRDQADGLYERWKRVEWRDDWREDAKSREWLQQEIEKAIGVAQQ